MHRILSGEIIPVCCGSAYKNKGVQKLLDAVIDYMPAPTDIPDIKGVDDDGNEVHRRSADDEPFSVACLRLRLDRNVDNRLRELHGLQDNRMLFVADGIAGQYGHCKVIFSPMDVNGEKTFEFESTVVGGSIPKEYIPAVQAGIEDAMKCGVLGG